MADEPKSDVVLLHSPTDDGNGMKVLRAREGKIETGEVRPLEEGKPLTGDVVTLCPREGTPRGCDVKVQYQAKPETKPGAKAHAGPAQVATDTYRDNWETIFGVTAKKVAALN